MGIDVHKVNEQDTKFIDFIWEEVDREWPSDKLAQFRQLDLFQNIDEKKFEVVKKLRYKFSFKVEDDEGKQSTVMIEDWETGELVRNCLRKYDRNEQKVCSDVRKKYFDDFAKTKGLYFFPGITRTHHFTAKKPFLIIGTFHPKHITQLSLF